MIYKDIQAVADMMNDAAEREAAYEAACSSWQAKAGSRGLIAESEDLEDVEVIDPSTLGFSEQSSGSEEDDYDEDCLKKSPEKKSKDGQAKVQEEKELAPTIAEADYAESLKEKVDLEECGFMLEDGYEDNYGVMHTDDEECEILVEVTDEDSFASNGFKKIIEDKFPVKVEMVSPASSKEGAWFNIEGKLGDIKEVYTYYVGKKSWDEVLDTPDENMFFGSLTFKDGDTFAEAQYREEVAKMLDDREEEEEQIDEADDREPISHGLDIVGVKASTADLAGQDEVEMTVVEKLQKRVDELEQKLLKGSCGPMNEGDEEDNEKLSPGWVKCCKCGAKLNKQIDTYRFTADGEPICYDCAEEDPDSEDTDDKELEEHVKAVLEQEDELDEGLKNALIGGAIGAGIGAGVGALAKDEISKTGAKLAGSTPGAKNLTVAKILDDVSQASGGTGADPAAMAKLRDATSFGDKLRSDVGVAVTKNPIASAAAAGSIAGAGVGALVSDKKKKNTDESEEEMMPADEFFGQLSEADEEDKVTQDEALQDMLDVAKTAKEIADKEEAGEQLEPEEKNYLKFAEDFCDCKLTAEYLKSTSLEDILKKVESSFIRLSKSRFAPSDMHMTGYHKPDRENNFSTKDEIYLNTSIDTDLGAHEKRSDMKRREREEQELAKANLLLPKRGNKHWNWPDFFQVIAKMKPEDARSLYYEMIRDAQASGNPKEEGLIKMMFGKKVHSANRVGGTALEYSDNGDKHGSRSAQSQYEARLLAKLQGVLEELSTKYPQVKRLLDLYNGLWTMRKQPEEQFLTKVDAYKQAGLIKGGEKPTRKGVFDAGVRMIFTKLGNMPKQITDSFIEEWLKRTPSTQWPEKWAPHYKEFSAKWHAGEAALS